MQQLAQRPGMQGQQAGHAVAQAHAPGQLGTRGAIAPGGGTREAVAAPGDDGGDDEDGFLKWMSSPEALTAETMFGAKREAVSASGAKGEAVPGSGPGWGPGAGGGAVVVAITSPSGVSGSSSPSGGGGSSSLRPGTKGGDTYEADGQRQRTWWVTEIDGWVPLRCGLGCH